MVFGKPKWWMPVWSEKCMKQSMDQPARLATKVSPPTGNLIYQKNSAGISGWDLQKTMSYNRHIFHSTGGMGAFGTGALGDIGLPYNGSHYRILKWDTLNQLNAVWLLSGKKCGMIHRTRMLVPCKYHSSYYPVKGSKENQNILVWWWIVTRRPSELMPEEAFGNWDGGVLLINTKVKMLMVVMVQNRGCCQPADAEEKMPKETIKQGTKVTTCNGWMPVSPVFWKCRDQFSIWIYGTVLQKVSSWATWLFAAGRWRIPAERLGW